MKITPNTPDMTKGDFAKDIYPDITYDTALPQPWVDQIMRECNFDPRPCVVWGYPKGSCFGMPLPLTLAAADFLSDLGYGDNFFWCDIVNPRIDRG